MINIKLYTYLYDVRCQLYLLLYITNTQKKNNQIFGKDRPSSSLSEYTRKTFGTIDNCVL